MCVLVSQSCLTLNDPMDCSLPGSSVHGILQARRREWVVMPSSKGSSWPRDGTSIYFVSCIVGRFFTIWATREVQHIHMLLLLLSHFNRVRLCATPSLGFSRQEPWSGLPFPSPMHKSEKWKWSRSVMSDSSRPHGLQPTRLLRPWDFPGKSTGVGCHCFLWHIHIIECSSAFKNKEIMMCVKM